MSEQTSDNGIEPGGGRLAAHERLSTGGLARWMRACATHPWRVILSWLGIIALLIALVATVGGSLKDQFEIPGSDTQKATDLIESEFASEQGGVLNLVFAAPKGERLDTPARKAAVAKAIALVKTKRFKATEDRAGVESVGDPFSDRTFAKNGRIAYAEAQFDRVIYDKDRDAVVAVEDAVRNTVAPAGVTAEFNGDAEFPPIEQGTQEILGLLAALLVLLIVFRTFVASAIPIALAITAVLSAFLLLFILAGLTDINTITPLLVSMIGIGVGIDYSLFIVTRFRQLLHDGLSPQDAAAEAGASAGRAVLFAGLTVAISVTGLAFFGLDFVTKLGIGSALGVLTTVLIANSLLIAVLSKLGHKIDRLKVPFLRPIDDSEAAREQERRAVGPFRDAEREGRLRRPAACGPDPRLDVGARPPRRLRPGDAARSADGPARVRPPRRGFRRRLQRTDPGRRRRERRHRAPRRLYQGVKRLDEVASVRQPQFNKEKTVAIVFVTPKSAPQDEATADLVDHLRSDVVPTATAGGNAVAYVSGVTAAFADIADRIMERLPLFLLYIIGVTFILLAMAFRSIVISLTAAVTTILSAFIGFGVLTLVVQEGHLLSLTGLDRTGPIETFVPPIAFAILFGLSMDYMVFLMSRIREEHVHGLKTRAAVEHGIAAIGRVVVAAAVIMGTVFTAFILTSDRISKEFGLLLAVAILTDALVVRMTLVPAFLTMLGEKAWYIPRWLDRLLPDLTIEPTATVGGARRRRGARAGGRHHRPLSRDPQDAPPVEIRRGVRRARSVALPDRSTPPRRVPRAASAPAVAAVAAVALLTVWWRPAAAAPPAMHPTGHGIPPGMRIPALGPPLPAAARRGLVQRLQQYPTLRLATRSQRAAAERLRRETLANGAPLAGRRCGRSQRVRGASRAPRAGRAPRHVAPRREARVARGRSPPRPAAPRHADLRRRAGEAPRPRRGDDQHAPRRLGPDAGRRDHAVALARRVRDRPQARPRPASRRLVPRGRAAPPGERDDARVVHEGPAKRVCHPRADTGALRRAADRAPVLLRGHDARDVTTASLG